MGRRGPPKGTPRSPNAGRKKGTPNKKSQALIDKCNEFGVDPFAILLDFAKNSVDPKMKFDAAKEVSQYLYPKRKATEISMEEENGFRVIIEDYQTPVSDNGNKNSAPAKAKAVPKGN